MSDAAPVLEVEVAEWTKRQLCCSGVHSADAALRPVADAALLVRAAVGR